MSWPELAEHLLTMLEAQGEDVSAERAAFAVMVAGCAASGCKRFAKGALDGENNS